MPKKTDKRVFPYYLKPSQRDEKILLYVGKFLRALRGKGKQSLGAVAKNAKVSIKEIEKIERGVFHCNLGHLRNILRLGYCCTLEDVLAGCYKEEDQFKKYFDAGENFAFEEEYYCLLAHGKKKYAPLLIGGEPEKYMWAASMRKLSEQPLVYTELLELAPERKRKPSGVTDRNTHDGIEVVFVIYGEIQVTIYNKAGKPQSETLEPEGCLHFHGRHYHEIRNLKGNSALLLIIRLPESLPSLAKATENSVSKSG